MCTHTRTHTQTHSPTISKECVLANLKEGYMNHISLQLLSKKDNAVLWWLLCSSLPSFAWPKGAVCSWQWCPVLWTLQCSPVLAILYNETQGCLKQLNLFSGSLNKLCLVSLGFVCLDYRLYCIHYSGANSSLITIYFQKNMSYMSTGKKKTPHWTN